MRQRIRTTTTLAIIAASTACASVQRLVRSDDTQTIAEHELDAARMAMNSSATFSGGHPKLRTIFAAVAAKDAAQLRTVELQNVAELLEDCHSPRQFTHVKSIWPSPHGLLIVVEHICSEDQVDGGTRVRVVEQETDLYDLKFARDPDAHRLPREFGLGGRYGITQPFVRYPVPADDGAMIVAPKDLAAECFAQVLMFYRSVSMGKAVIVPMHEGDEVIYHVVMDVMGKVMRGDIEPYAGAFARFADLYSGQPDGIATPWEILRFKEDVPSLLMVAFGQTRDPNVLVGFEHQGVDILNAAKVAHAIEALEYNFGSAMQTPGWRTPPSTLTPSKSPDSETDPEDTDSTT